MKIVTYLCSLVVPILCLAIALEFGAGALLPDAYRGYLVQDGDKVKWTLGPFEPSQPTSGFNGPVLRKKPANTLRIVSLGDSGTEGWLTARTVFNKYGQDWASKNISSYSRALEFSLNEVVAPSGKRVEVINLGIAAYNITDVIRMLKDSLQLEPDLLLIQPGGNETWTGERSRWSTYVSDDLPYLQVELGHEVFSEMQAGWATLSTDSNAFSPMALFNSRPQPVVIEPDGRAEGLAHRLDVFTGELDRLGDYLDGLGIPFFFLVPTQNLADFQPFGSMAQPGTSAAELEGLNSLLLEALADTGPGAREKYQRVLDIDDGIAEANYQMGRIYLAEANPDKAREHFWKANDRDLLLKRLPGYFHDVTRRFIAERGYPYIDVMKFYEAASDTGVVGYNWLDDDVHPNREAQFNLAREIALQLSASGRLDAIGYAGDLQQLPDFAAYNEWTGFDDEARGDIAYLKAAHNFLAFGRFRQRIKWHPEPARFISPIVDYLETANTYAPSNQSLYLSAVLNLYLGREDVVAGVLTQSGCAASAERAAEVRSGVGNVMWSLFGRSNPAINDSMKAMLESQGCGE